MHPDQTAEDLARYYDQEASQRNGWQRDAALVRHREAFVALIVAEARCRLLEIGTGTGQDAAAFIASEEVLVTGVDLSPESVRLARERGVDARCASLFDLPFEDASFDAAWTMSTLIHVSDQRWNVAWGEITRVLVPRAPVAVGVWGSGMAADAHGVKEADTIEPKRVFFRRSDRHLRLLLESIGTLDAFFTWAVPGSQRPYQYAVVRTMSP